MESTPPRPGGSNRETALDVTDASRRTHLANERTYLAWWRTGLASLAVGIGAGRLVPLLAHGVRWPYVLSGAGFATVGVGFIALALVRHRQVERALARGEFAALDAPVILTLALVGILFGVVIVVLVITG